MRPSTPARCTSSRRPNPVGTSGASIPGAGVAAGDSRTTGRRGSPPPTCSDARRARGTRPDLLAEDREVTECILRGRRRQRGGGERRSGKKERQQHKPGQAGRGGPVLRGGHFVAGRAGRRPAGG